MRARWRVLAALLALIAAAVLMWVRSLRQQAWLEQMLENRCWPLVSMADLVALAWGSAALVVLAGVVLVRGGSRGTTRPGGRTARALLMAGVAVLVLAALFVLYVVTLPTGPLEGVDGSGLPCGGG